MFFGSLASVTEPAFRPGCMISVTEPLSDRVAQHHSRAFAVVYFCGCVGAFSIVERRILIPLRFVLSSEKEAAGRRGGRETRERAAVFNTLLINTHDIMYTGRLVAQQLQSCVRFIFVPKVGCKKPCCWSGTHFCLHSSLQRRLSVLQFV